MKQGTLDGLEGAGEDVGGTFAAYAQVAVPVPLPDALTYGVPETLLSQAQVGCRVKVSVGRRLLTGVVMALSEQAPEGFKVKSIAEALDLEPVVPHELLELAEFIAGYYLAPIGESVRLMIPGDLPPWGDRRVSLTDGGALAPARDAEEAAIVAFLLESPRSRLADMQRKLGLPDLARRLDSMRSMGRVSVEEPGRRGGRFVKAVELAPGELQDHLEAAGRSPKGRAVLEMLAALGRPATLREIKMRVECGPAVITRLSKLGLLREFMQPERLSMERHRLSSPDSKQIVLRADQRTAVEALLSALESEAFRPFLLHGMTGSGKTEVYLRAVSACLDMDRGSILMVPEIALVPALAGEVRARFGSELAVLHSGLSSSERQQEWGRIRRGEARVVLGPRSALWAPVQRLGLLVVDEEHDASYKQDKAPRYNGRDLALLRARNHNAVAVLASATPSLESRHNVTLDRLDLLFLSQRAGVGELPRSILVDLRQETGARQPGEVHFSGRLMHEIRATLDADEQAILMRNRRGYAPILLCRSCGEDHRCEDCGLPMTYHRRGHRLACHYCGHEQPAPRRCRACEEPALEPMGAGTERVEERFRELFPGVAVDVLDADVSRRSGGAAAVLERFSQGRTQVLIGTQMVAKGHHFPRVSLAAVMFADTYLSFPDFRAVERTYALLTQLAGRAGRGDRPGRVVIQTYHPDHYAIQAALHQNDTAFAEEEMRFRRIFHYPPYTRVVKVLAQSADKTEALDASDRLARILVTQPEISDVRLVGPSAAPLERLRGKWRFQLLLRGTSGARIKRMLLRSLDLLSHSQRAVLTVDVDPQDLM